jgi:hypothetical protein
LPPRLLLLLLLLLLLHVADHPQPLLVLIMPHLTLCSTLLLPPLLLPLPPMLCTLGQVVVYQQHAVLGSH